ncbi:MAG: hypothetical protein ACJ79E_20145, partial [Anaeromyxobacteraceae bacterium]
GAYAGLSAGPSVSPDLAGLAVRIAVEEGGPATYDAVLARLEGSDAEHRANLLYALATADSPSLSGRAGSLWRDPRLKPTERLFPALLDDDRGVMRRTYDQMSTAMDAMVAAIPPFHESQLALAAREICDSGAELARARDLLTDVVQRYPSMRTTAARALEHAEVCAAERDAERGAARAWFDGESDTRPGGAADRAAEESVHTGASPTPYEEQVPWASHCSRFPGPQSPQTSLQHASPHFLLWQGGPQARAAATPTNITNRTMHTPSEYSLLGGRQRPRRARPASRCARATRDRRAPS